MRYPYRCADYKNQMVKENVIKWCQARLSPPLVGQIIAEASLDTPEDYMLDVYNEYVERRKFLIDGLNRIPGCYSPIPMGPSIRLPNCRWMMPISSVPGVWTSSNMKDRRL